MMDPQLQHGQNDWQCTRATATSVWCIYGWFPIKSSPTSQAGTPLTCALLCPPKPPAAGDSGFTSATSRVAQWCSLATTSAAPGLRSVVEQSLPVNGNCRQGHEVHGGGQRVTASSRQLGCLPNHARMSSPACRFESLKHALTTNSTSVSCIGTRRLKTTRQIRAAPSCTAGEEGWGGRGYGEATPTHIWQRLVHQATQVHLTCHHELLAYDI